MTDCIDSKLRTTENNHNVNTDHWQIFPVTMGAARAQVAIEKQRREEAYRLMREAMRQKVEVQNELRQIRAQYKGKYGEITESLDRCIIVLRNNGMACSVKDIAGKGLFDKPLVPLSEYKIRKLIKEGKFPKEIDKRYKPMLFFTSSVLRFAEKLKKTEK